MQILGKLTQFLGILTQFLKRHYEKIILCAVLLGLAAAAIVMGTKITAVKTEITDTTPPAPSHGRPPPSLNMSNDLEALRIVTNPPPVILSGDHNLFNPVTWKRKANGDLLKVLQTGPDALTVSNITPLYTVIAFDHPASGASGIYVMSVQEHSGSKHSEYAKVGEKPKSGLYIIRGIKGAPDNPDDLILDIPDTGETNVLVSKDAPYKRVDGYTVDLWYGPESHPMPKQKVGDQIMLDNEPYKIIEITNDLIRVEDINNTKVTPVRWKESQ